MSFMTSNVWSSSRLEFRVDTLDGDARWQMNPEEQTWIFHLGGRLHKFKTKTASGLSSEDLPLPGEIWKIGAGEVYQGAARGEGMAYLLLRLSARDHKALRGETGSDKDTRLGFYHPQLTESLLDLPHSAFRDAFEQAKTRILSSLELYLPQESRRAESPCLSEAAAQAIQTLIEQRLEERLRIEDLLEVSGLSRSQLCREFQGTFGTSPGNYILRKKIRRAAGILAKQPPTDLSSLAFDLGFSSHSHFSYAFRGIMGLTPSVFARGLTIS